jgi:hypothetical protein
VVAVAGVILWAGLSARPVAAQAPTPSVPVTTEPVSPPATIAESAPAAPAAEPGAAAPAAAAPAATPAPVRAVGPVPIGDASPPPSDHDAVVGRIGVSAQRLDTGPVPLTLRPGLGCATDAGVSCTVTVGAFGVRYWTSRNLALNGALALAAGGGSTPSTTLDTYLGVGPVVGLSVLLASWRHLSVLASPQLAFLWFRPAGGDTSSTVMFDLQAAFEAELHFGFIGVPALSIGLLAGGAVQYESAPGVHVWTVGVIGGGSVWNALTALSLRYYL